MPSSRESYGKSIIRIPHLSLGTTPASNSPSILEETNMIIEDGLCLLGLNVIIGHGVLNPLVAITQNVTLALLNKVTPIPPALTLSLVARDFLMIIKRPST
jgi:hypothetical protein